jgi:hypothetical protein
MFQRRYRLFHFLFIIIMQTFPVLYIPTLEVIGKWKAPDILLSSWSFVEDPAISVYICTALLFNYVNPWQSDLVEHQRSPKICDRIQYKMHPLHLNFKVTSFHPLDAFTFRFYDLGRIACWHIMHLLSPSTCSFTVGIFSQLIENLTSNCCPLANVKLRDFFAFNFILDRVIQ